MRHGLRPPATIHGSAPDRGRKTGEILVSWGVIHIEELKEALIAARRPTLRIGQILVRNRVATELDVYRALSAKFGLPLLKLEDNVIDPAVLSLVLPDFVRTYRMAPIHRDGETYLVALEDPNHLPLVSSLEAMLLGVCSPALVLPGSIDRAGTTLVV